MIEEVLVMIIEKNNVFQLDTNDTSYIMRVSAAGHLLNEYYGRRIRHSINNNDFSKEKWPYAHGCSVIYDDKGESGYCLDLVSLEYSSIGKGDYREPSIELKTENGYVLDFKYDSYVISKGGVEVPGLPTPHDADETLSIKLVDTVAKLSLVLTYMVFEKANVIARSVKLVNESSSNIEINKIMSMQLDMLNQDFTLVNFNGAWIGEMHQSEKTLGPGIYVNDSKTGCSSNRHNPFFMLKNKECVANYGNCYAFNLIYSGNHREEVELTTFDKVRVQLGVNSYCFNWILKPNESFDTPFAVMTFSSNGYNKASQNMHAFTNNHVVRGEWANKPRPILINNWEATYFKFTEGKLNSLAKLAADIGIELFVLDDGWFGSRTDDTKGLGDWYVNPKKLPQGLDHLANKINKLGMKFGLWFEPEMVNQKSELYTQHPEWAIKCPERKESLGRNQMVLNLSIEAVQDYIVGFLDEILSSANIEYVKWDMNRNISDIYSKEYNQGELFHRYTLGLYRILDIITKKYPKVLFESCASGGNRFDLGMMSYMHQTWCSDDTDGYERILIQSGTSSGYPLSTMGCHVSASPSHQLLRRTPIDTRFNVASFGCLGYELDLHKLSPVELRAVKAQIEFYKAHRSLLQYGTFYQLKNMNTDGYASWMVLNDDRSEGVIGYYQGLAKANPKIDVLSGINLIDDKLYNVEVRYQEVNIKTFGGLINMITPVNLNEDGFLVDQISKHKTMDGEKESYEVYGDAINSGAIKLYPQFAGTGFDKNVRLLADFGSRLYYFHTIEKKD